MVAGPYVPLDSTVGEGSVHSFIDVGLRVGGKPPRGGVTMRGFNAVVGAGLVLAAAWLAACGDDGPLNLPVGAGGSGGDPVSTGGFSPTAHGGGGAGGEGGVGGELPFCEGKGPPIEIPQLGDCANDLATIFLFGICSCSDINASNVLLTDSFNSNESDDVKVNGSIGLNGTYTGLSPATLHGTLWSAGPTIWQNTHEIDKQVRCGSTLTVASPSTVHDDLYVADDITTQPDYLTVDGTLHIPSGKGHVGVVADDVVNEAVSVEAPCNCGDPLDIAGIVASFENDNDNAMEGLDPDVLVGATGDVDLSLPCGRYYFNGAATSGANITIELQGRTAILIAGDLIPTGAFSINLGPDAELDLFIAGDLTVKNDLSLGDKAHPARSRVYVAGSGTLTSASEMAMNLYLPNDVLSVQNDLEVWGSLFVGGLDFTSPLTVHYDEAILDVDGCPDPDTPCEDCHDCVNPTPACVDGFCDKCKDDGDCCPPFICLGNGTCALEQPD